MNLLRWILDKLIAPFVVAVVLLFCTRETLTGVWLTVSGTGNSLGDWLQATTQVPRWRFIATTACLYVLAFYLWMQSRKKKREIFDLHSKIDRIQENIKETQDALVTLTTDQAFVLQEMYKIAPNQVVTPHHINSLMSLQSEQHALALIESLRNLGLVIRMRNTRKGFPEFKLSGSGRQLMLQEGHKIKTAERGEEMHP